MGAAPVNAYSDSLRSLGPPFSWVADLGLGPWGSGALLVGILLLGALAYAFMRRCPHCGVWLAGRVVGQELLGSEEGWVPERRKPSVLNPSLRPASRLEKGPFVYITVRKIKRNLSCRKCGKQWSENVQEFDQDWIKGRVKELPW